MDLGRTSIKVIQDETSFVHNTQFVVFYGSGELLVHDDYVAMNRSQVAETLRDNL